MIVEKLEGKYKPKNLERKKKYKHQIWDRLKRLVLEIENHQHSTLYFLEILDMHQKFVVGF